MSLWTTTLRLNLDKSDHRKACEILKKSDMSHTKFIVTAVLAYAEAENNNKILLSEFSKIIKAEIGEALKNCNAEPNNISENESRINTKADISIPTAVEKNEKPADVSPTENSEDDNFDENIDMDFLEM